MSLRFYFPMLGALVICMAGNAAQAELLAHWDFEEGAGTTAADSVGSNDGSFVGTEDPLWVASKSGLGSALQFNGLTNTDSANSVFINTTLGGEPQFSVAAWMYWDVDGFAESPLGVRRFSTIASKASQWNNDPSQMAMLWKLTIISDQEPTWPEADQGLYLERAALYTSGPETQTGSYGGGVKVASKTADLPPANEWVHVVATFDGTDTKFYFNGVEQADDSRATDVNDSYYYPASPTSAMTNSRFQIGSAYINSSSRNAQVFNGSLDEVYYYDHALSQSEIDDLFSPGGLQADFDVDGDVDGADFLSWQRGYGSPYTGTDLVNWQNEYGTSAPLAGVNAVPEPSSVVLLLSAFMFLGNGRREKCAN